MFSNARNLAVLALLLAPAPALSQDSTTVQSLIGGGVAQESIQRFRDHQQTLRSLEGRLREARLRKELCALDPSDMACISALPEPASAVTRLPKIEEASRELERAATAAERQSRARAEAARQGRERELRAQLEEQLRMVALARQSEEANEAERLAREYAMEEERRRKEEALDAERRYKEAQAEAERREKEARIEAERRENERQARLKAEAEDRAARKRRLGAHRLLSVYGSGGAFVAEIQTPDGGRVAAAAGEPVGDIAVESVTASSVALRLEDVSLTLRLGS